MKKTIVLSDDSQQFTLRIDEEGILRATLEVQGAGCRLWPTAPLAEAVVYDKMERRSRCAQWQVDELSGGDRAAYVRLCLPYEEISVGLHLTIQDGELRVSMPMVECYELRDRIQRLMTVRLLPGLARAGADGQVLLPLQSGMLFSPKGKPAVRDEFMIYGEQSRWELLPTLPLCGVTDSDAGLLFLATKGAPEILCEVETDGKSNGQTGLSFSLRRFWPDPVCRDDREIRIIPFDPAEQDLVNFAGHRLRRHIIDDFGKPTLKQRAKESTQVRQLLESHLIRIFHGMQPIGMAAAMDQKDVINIREPFVSATTFAQAREGLRRLHDAGIERMHVEN